MTRPLSLVALLCAILASPAPALSAGPSMPGAFTPHPVTFPADAAMHANAPVEWWYIVGHLSDAAGRTYGFETTMFKFSGLQRYIPASGVDTVLRSDVAVTDEAAKRFYHGITYVPSQPPLTVASTHELRLRAAAITMETLGPLRYRVRGSVKQGGVDLVVAAQRPPMLVHGGFLGWGAGYTYYYSLTHLSAIGTVTVRNRRMAVQGIAWMDHQWGDMGGSSVRGWDWMALQLDDHTDLSLVNERTTNPRYRFSHWTMAMLPDNRQMYVPQATIIPLGVWHSPSTGIVYPSGWRVRVSKLQLDVIVRPTVRDQEMYDTFMVSGYRSSYWEGSCTVTGIRAGHHVTGKAYTELTGYGQLPPMPSF